MKALHQAVLQSHRLYILRQAAQAAAQVAAQAAARVAAQAAVQAAARAVVPVTCQPLIRKKA